MTDLRRLLHRWQAEGEVVEVRLVEGRPAIGADPETPLSPPVSEALKRLGIERLYRHQARAIDLIRAGNSTVVVAGTAAGKTLCYQVPIAEATVADPDTTALCLYPTKALAQDQARSFASWASLGIRADTYDGDTPDQERRRIRRSPGVVLTNPDMLHVGVLPFHERWGNFFHRLRYVVVDELHSLRGIFGTHVALVLRRLRRICKHYGSDPVFVFGSATIGNPGPLASALADREVAVVTGDDSAQGDRWYLLWNPELVDAAEGRRRSALTDATRLVADLVAEGVTTIAFARSRRATELMYRWVRELLDPALRKRVGAYRGGYLASQRRQVEQLLFSGELVGVITTNALELGIDVGGMQAAVLVTFPGTLSSFRQQAGRAGRGTDSSLVVLVAGEDALDQYYLNHPDALFGEAEAVVVNPSNPSVLEAHLACAAHELPLRLEDRELFGPEMEEVANRLVQDDHLRMKDGALFWARRYRPAARIDLRAAGRRFDVVEQDGRLLGVLEESRALRDAHPGAVYLHQGDTFISQRLDWERGEVVVVRADVDYYTQPKVETDLEVLAVVEETTIGRARWHLGAVRVHSQVIGYQRRALRSREVLETTWLDLPSTTYETNSTWMAIPEEVARAVPRHRLPGALHAAEHAAIALLPLRAVCDRWDIGGLSTPWHPAATGPAIFVYEAYPGGAGISEIAYGAGLGHWRETSEMIRACPCRAGCPSCIQSPKCGNLNEPLDKEGAVVLLSTITG